MIQKMFLPLFSIDAIRGAGAKVYKAISTVTFGFFPIATDR
jgi:hypothetical protein